MASTVLLQLLNCTKRIFVEKKAGAYRHACHCEVKRGHVHGFFAGSIDDFWCIRVIHPYVRIWTLRHIC